MRKAQKVNKFRFFWLVQFYGQATSSAKCPYCWHCGSNLLEYIAAKRIEMLFGMEIGLGQCHSVLDGIGFP